MLRRYQIVECVVQGVCDSMNIEDWRKLQYRHSGRTLRLSFARTMCATLLSHHLNCTFESTHHYFSMFGNVDSARRGKNTFSEQMRRSMDYHDYFKMAEFCIEERLKQMKREMRGFQVPKRMKFIHLPSKMNMDADKIVS